MNVSPKQRKCTPQEASASGGGAQLGRPLHQGRWQLVKQFLRSEKSLSMLKYWFMGF